VRYKHLLLDKFWRCDNLQLPLDLVDRFAVERRRRTEVGRRSDNEQEAEQPGICCSFVCQIADTPGFLRAKDVPRCKFPAETAKTAKKALGPAQYLQFTR
jgi:hypothetical protein